MVLFKNIKNFLYKADFFYSTELLRYKGEPEFRTIFGGVLSLLIIVTLIATFYNKFVDTLNKVVITSVSSNLNAANPTPFTISTFDQNYFMFGVQIWHHDLNTGHRYFDMVLTSAEFKTGDRQNKSIEYKLEPCQLSHWEGFPDIQQNFTRLKMYQWLCLPKNKTFNIQGKYASQFSQTLEVAVKKCKNSSKESRPCASQEQIDKYFKKVGPFFFTIYFLNPLINPTSQQYLTYYLEDNNYIIFTDKFGSEGILFMEEYQITTDQSILPYTQIRDNTGGIVKEFALKNPYQVTSNMDIYCSFSFFKSGIKRTYQRNFQKLDEILSYIGGLFGTVAVILFIVNAYNSNSFQITLGASLFHNENLKQQNQLKNYNFLSFLIHLVYLLFDLVGWSPNWKMIKKYHQCRQQMKRQLDIIYLLERVFFLERTMNTLLDQHQVKGLYLHEKLTLEQAKKNRQYFKVKRILMKQNLQSKRKSQTLKHPQRKSNQVTEKTLEMLDPGIYQTKKQDIFMDIKNHSNQSESNQSHKGPSIKIFPSNLLQPSDGQISDITGSSDSEEDQISVNFAQDIKRLKRQSERGNGLSKKIWHKIKPSLRKKIGRNQSVQENSQSSFSSNKQEQSENERKYLESSQSQEYSLGLHSPVKFMRLSQMKINNPKQFLNQNTQLKQYLEQDLKAFENVLIENQLKNSPPNLS